MDDKPTDRLAIDLEILAALFKSGGWRELRVESECLSLLISEDPSTPSLGGGVSARAPAAMAPATPTARAADAPTRPPAVAATGVPSAPGAVDGIDPDWFAIKAPNLGTFYRSPKPGSPAFVEVGQRVDAKTEVCLIEVMKLFTSVQAGVAGTVRQIAVADAELVEGGQALIYIQCD